MLQFAATRENNQVEFAAFLFCHVTAAEHSVATHVHGDVVQDWNGLARQREQSRPVDSLHRRYKGACRFFGISWSNHINVRHQANRADRLHWFMRRTVLANAYRIVSKNVNVRKFRYRAEANGSSAIVREHHERRARCAEQSMIRN